MSWGGPLGPPFSFGQSLQCDDQATYGGDHAISGKLLVTDLGIFVIDTGKILKGQKMKSIFLATSVLALSAGFAAAEVTLSGDARMGVISDFGSTDMAFTSRARVKFTLSGSTDGGLEFGASFRADNAPGAASGTAGSVFISGAFGKLSMGDVDGAANAAVGQVSGVGLVNSGDLNEVIYLANGGSDLDIPAVAGVDTVDPSALYEYSTGDLTIYASVTNPSGPADAYAIAAKYALGDYTVSLGYEDLQGTNTSGFDNDIQHIVIGATATFGAATVKAIYGQANGLFDGFTVDNEDQFAVSVDYKMDAMTVTAFYTDDFIDFGFGDTAGAEAYGLGASYDLGGGASVAGGYVQNQTTDEDAYDLGVSMSF